LDNDPSLATEPDSEAEHSDDTTTKVARLAATYDSSGESQADVAAKPRGSLFGGPAGPQIPLEPDISGFEDMFEEKGPRAPTDAILQEDSGVDMNSFDFSKSSSEEDAEPETEAGAEQEISSQPPNADHDAKPDMTVSHDPTPPNFEYNPTSPTYSQAPSNTSHISQKSSASEILELVDLIGSGDLYAADSKETPEEFSKHELVVETQPPCSCEYRCQHRVAKEFNLRLGPRQEGCVYFNNIVVDTDNTGTYDNEQGKYPSSQIVDIEDLDEDEDSLHDGVTDPMGRYNTTIPFNHIETRIRDRRVFDEESSSSDESQTKAKKKRKKTKSKSSKATKKSKNNNGIATPRASDSDEDDDIKIDEQGSTPAPKTPAAKKKAPSTAVPNQTIVQMLQRLAKPHLTKLSYPVTFNSSVSSCSICNSASYAIYGASSTPRKIKIYDFGQGNTEIPDANQAGNAIASSTAIKPNDTNLCLACTTSYMKILMCSTHEISSISPLPQSSSSSSSPSSQTPPSYTTAELQTTCSICPTPATYTCDSSCGARFCDTCAGKVYGEFDGSLSKMLEGMTDEVTSEYARGLRADVELLRKGGELWRFLERMARQRGG
jgi:hypothetical protein